MFLAAPVPGHEVILKQNDALLIDVILDNICWVLYKIQEYCIFIQGIVCVQFLRNFLITYMLLDISNSISISLELFLMTKEQNL